jgi:hypothetical protein
VSPLFRHSSQPLVFGRSVRTCARCVQRFAEVWSLRLWEGMFEADKAFDHALARGVLRCAPYWSPTWRPPGTLLHRMGPRLREDLGLFVSGLLLRVDADAQQKSKAREAYHTGCNRLPTPAPDVPFAAIIEFKERRADELLRLREYMDGLYTEVISAGDILAAKCAALDKVDRALPEDRVFSSFYDENS